jgi:hypothetical protein
MGSLDCKIELDKQKGITVTVVNSDGKITQTVTMDGTTLTIQVQGQNDTSSWTQKQDSIAIKCKTFTLDAETITCKSTKATDHESQDAFTVKSTKDMTWQSQAKIVGTATSDMNLSGQNVAIAANQALSGKGPTGVTIEASGGDAQLHGMTVTLKGDTGAKLQGLTVDIKADTQLNAEGTAMATLKGQMASLSGSLVKIGS